MPNELEGFKLAQEMLEQIDHATLAKSALKSRQELRDIVEDYLIESFGVEQPTKRDISATVTLIYEFDCKSVFSWIDLAIGKVGIHGNDDYRSMASCMQYMHGIAKNKRKERNAILEPRP